MTGICAIVVTFHPTPEVAPHISALLTQVDRLVIVDNQSGNNLPPLLLGLSSHPAVHFISNPTNLGIAAAFNQGLRYALDQGYAWIATFDQDSHVPPDYLERMLETWSACPDKDRVAIVAPTFLLRKSASPSPSTLRSCRSREIPVAMASGNLVRTEAVRAVGFMDEEFFIDYVDFEYCLRLRRHGWKILQALDVFLPHRLGQLQEHRFLGLKFTLVCHSALRRYYITRNRLTTYRRYGLRFPAFLLWDACWWLGEMAKIICCEDAKAAKFRCVWRGIRDAWRGQLGPAAPEILEWAQALET